MESGILHTVKRASFKTKQSKAVIEETVITAVPAPAKTAEEKIKELEEKVEALLAAQNNTNV